MSAKQKRPANAYCQNCSAKLAVDGWKVGMEEGFDSRDENLKCGCRYCWHCSDNRGRHEDHDPKCNGPEIPGDWLREYATNPQSEYV